MAGTVKQERILATQVRQISLTLIKKYLEDESEGNDKFRKDLILKLAATTLPRITQLEGEDGEPIKVNVISYNPAPPDAL